MLQTIVSNLSGMPIQKAGEGEYTISMGGVTVMFGVKGDVLYCTTDAVVKSALDGADIESLASMSKIFKGQSGSFYVDFEGVNALTAQLVGGNVAPQVEAALSVLAMFEDLEAYGTMKGGTAVVNMTDKEQNSFKTICDKIGELIRLYVPEAKPVITSGVYGKRPSGIRTAVSLEIKNVGIDNFATGAPCVFAGEAAPPGFGGLVAGGNLPQGGVLPARGGFGDGKNFAVPLPLRHPGGLHGEDTLRRGGLPRLFRRGVERPAPQVAEYAFPGSASFRRIDRRGEYRPEKRAHAFQDAGADRANARGCGYRR